MKVPVTTGRGEWQAVAPDVLIVSLGTTAGLRTADAALAGALRRAGASVGLEQIGVPSRLPPTLALQDLVLARRASTAVVPARAVLYSTTTAALLWPRPGAIRFDALSAANRPGRHGVWQRPLERRRLEAAPVLAPWSAGALAKSAPVATPSVVVPVPVEGDGPGGERDVAALTYGTNPGKKGLDRVLGAWALARREGEVLVVLGGPPVDAPGVRWAPLASPREWRALLRRAQVYVTAPRREDYGLAQLEALAEGCRLVTTASPGPYAALPVARSLDPRLVGDDLAAALRVALDDPAAGYAERAAQALRPWRPEAVDEVVAQRLLPALLAGGW
jgi:glycosyltransferase involved in cell wall biosynthesis